METILEGLDRFGNQPVMETILEGLKGLEYRVATLGLTRLLDQKEEAASFGQRTEGDTQGEARRAARRPGSQKAQKVRDS
jgi:hypothetical protein